MQVFVSNGAGDAGGGDGGRDDDDAHRAPSDAAAAPVAGAAQPAPPAGAGDGGHERRKVSLDDMIMTMRRLRTKKFAHFSKHFDF